MEVDNIENLSIKDLDKLIHQYPWFTALRVARSRRVGGKDPLLTLSPYKNYFVQTMPIPDKDEFDRLRHENMVNKFLSKNIGRIIPTDEEIEGNDLVSKSIEEDPDLISENLAEIYLNQGYKDKSRSIYKKLSLLYPEKSVYFAEIIAKIDSES